jgi:hypothetical protein
LLAGECFILVNNNNNNNNNNESMFNDLKGSVELEGHVWRYFTTDLKKKINFIFLNQYNIKNK